MPDTTHSRSGQQAVLPDDVTDPMLWRLAQDVAAAHEPDESGRCQSLLCADQSTPCAPMLNARRAIQLARGGAAPERRSAHRETPARVPRNRRREAA